MGAYRQKLYGAFFSKVVLVGAVFLFFFGNMGIFVKVFLGLHLFPSRQLISLSISGFIVTHVKCVGYFSFAN